MKKFEEISKKKFTNWFIYTLTFSRTTVFKEVSFPPRVLVHTLCFFLWKALAKAFKQKKKKKKKPESISQLSFDV